MLFWKGRAKRLTMVFFSLYFWQKTTENIELQNELERMSWENNQASTKIVTRFYTTNDRMSVDQCPTTKTDTNKLWQLIATIAQLQKPVRNHQGENYPFFQSNKKSQAKSLLGLSHFIEVLHESTNYWKMIKQIRTEKKYHPRKLNLMKECGVWNEIAFV